MSPQIYDRGSGNPDQEDVHPPGAARSAEWTKSYGSGLESRNSDRFKTFHEGLSLTSLLSVVFKRKWTVITILLLGIGISVLYAYTATPIYRSEATIEVGEESKESIKTLGEGSQRNLESGDRGATETEGQIFKSRSPAQTLVERMNLDKSPRFSRRHTLGLFGSLMERMGAFKTDGSGSVSDDLTKEKLKAAATEWVLKSVHVKQQGRTRLLKVAFEADDPNLARELLENYIDIYFDENLRKRRKAVVKTGEWLKDELDHVEKKLVKSLTSLIAFISSHGLVSLDDNANHIITFFNKATERLAKTNEQLNQLEATTLGLGHSSVAVLPPGVQPVDLLRLQERLTLMESEYAEKIQVYSEQYPRVEMLKRSIETLRNKVSEMEKSAVTKVIEVAKQQEVLDHKAFERIRKEAINVNALGVDYAVLKNEVETNEQMFKVLLQKSQEMALNAQLIGNNLHLIDPPEKPIRPVKPKKLLIILFGSFMGLSGGITMAYLLQRIDNKIHKLEDVERELNLCGLGVVPDIAKLKMKSCINGGNGRYEFLPHDSPRSLVADCVGNITNSITLLSTSGKNRCYLFTSAVPGEGKTFLSVACAATLASEDRSVLVVDADLRKPSLGKVFGLKDKAPGLSTLIKRRDIKLSSVIHRSRVPGLFFLTAGPTPSNPAAYLRSPRMGKVLDYLKQNFDLLILDTPPAVGFPDVALLKDYCDSIILVARAGKTPVDLLQRAAKLLSSFSGNTLGVVLNMVDWDSSRSGSSPYSNHWGYYEDEGPCVGGENKDNGTDRSLIPKIRTRF